MSKRQPPRCDFCQKQATHWYTYMMRGSTWGGHIRFRCVAKGACDDHESVPSFGEIFDYYRSFPERRVKVMAGMKQ